MERNITLRRLLPPIPNHNNNQPFNNVNLAVNEVEVSQDEQDVATGNDRVTVYSLYDDVDHGGGGIDRNVDLQLPRPSEDLKFLTNEYGFLELLEEDTFSEYSSCTSSSDSSPPPSDSEEDNATEIPDEEEEDEPLNSCVSCGCYALQKEFYDAKHCTYDCSVITRINEFREQRRIEEEEIKNGVKREMEELEANGVKEEVDSKRIKLEVIQEDVKVEVEEVVVEEVQEKIVCNPFRINDLLEAIDPQHQSLFCPVTVVEVIGFRLLLKFVNYSDKYNFWANADSKYIFPVNWSSRYNDTHNTTLHFHSPPNFTWNSYIQQNNTHRIAPDSNFPHISKFLEHPESHVKVGMKVEAVDRRNKNLICVATVSCVMGDRFLIHFDSWDSLYDYWTFIGSGDIFYCGYCNDNGIELVPPHCYENASEFDWEEYLKKTNSTPMPRDLISRTAPLPFQTGQQVEVIDKRSPRLLRLAVIQQIEPTTQTLTITFPSLKSDLYDYDIHAHSEYIHQESWGSSTGHPLADDEEEPDNMSRSPSPDNTFPICPNHKICKSVCNVRGPNFPFHSKLRDCPYSIPNMQEYSESGKFTDRVVVFEDSHYDNIYGLRVANKGHVEVEKEDPTPENNDSSNDKEQIEQKPTIKLDIKSTVIHNKPQTQALISRNSNPINFSNYDSPQVKATQASKSAEIPKRSEILTWGHDRISSLIYSLCSNLPTAQKVADQFKNNLIDGESFLMLTQSDMTDALGIKLGPAVKIYNLIRLIDLNK